MNQNQKQNQAPENQERSASRFEIRKRVDWDFYSRPDGSKAGYITDLSEKGCGIRTIEALDPNRWVRIALKDPDADVYFTCVGKVAWSRARVENWDSETTTLQRCGIEFTRPISPMLLERLRPRLDSETEAVRVCERCQRRTGLMQGAVECVSCHLKTKCRDLIYPQELVEYPEDPVRRALLLLDL